ERYKHLHGKFAFVPLINRRIPIITDEYVTMDFGTGALKVTPAHDMNDNMLGQKHGLEVIDILNDDGTLGEAAQILVGEERFTARKKIVQLLEAANAIEKIEDYTSEVGYSERTDTVVEPRLSLQWWVAMKKISEPALNAVMNDEIKFHPSKFKNTYRYWMENIKDWCISRQLWWGHRIPAWYGPKKLDGDQSKEEPACIIAATKEAATALFTEYYVSQGYTETVAKNAAGNIEQDKDCLDTWFSSWLWPFEVFKGYSNPGNAEVKYYYPTNTLVTAPEIIFFWVARMIIAGEEYMGAKPFNDVYFTGIVRDKLGRKMSKSLGNSPDLLELIDNYGADAVRFGIMFSSPAGNDLMFDESSLEQGKFFNNKLWNALKLIKMWEGRQAVTQESLAGTFAVMWFENRLNEVKAEVDILIQNFKLSEALKTIYSLIWDDFCSWYLEWVKPGFEQLIDVSVQGKTVAFFTELMQLLHPFMPFVTEEIYHLLLDTPDDLCVKQFSAIPATQQNILNTGALLKESITAIRDARNKARLKPKDEIGLYIQPADKSHYAHIEILLAKQVNAKAIHYTSDSIPQSIAVVMGKDKFYLVTDQPLVAGNQREELLKEQQHLAGFLASIEKKLGNERFVLNAKPEIIELERKKKSDAEAKLKVIEQSLSSL
ncbi:MAG: class I tRNA ligase family protein, partial [Bacteroidota bacterium]